MFNKILRYNQDQKSTKTKFDIHTNAESLLKIMGTRGKDPEKSFTLYIFHSMAKKTNIISGEVKSASKGFTEVPESMK